MVFESLKMKLGTIVLHANAKKQIYGPFWLFCFFHELSRVQGDHYWAENDKNVSPEVKIQNLKNGQQYGFSS